MSSPTASTRTLVIALVANLGIAVSKFVAAAITGSSAMLTEGVHSVVDSTNQLLLMWGRHAAKRAPDRYHPFGYGRELYFWSFVVAVLVFALGAGVSIYEGIIHIAHPEHAVSPVIAYGVLLVAFLLEGWSTLEAFQEFKAAKGGTGWFEAIRLSKDPPSFIVLLENGAAMAGIVAAAAGLFLAQITGNPFYDGAASIVIGLILGLTAFLLAYESKGLLIGEAAEPELVSGLAQLVSSQKGVVAAGEVLTVHSSPDQVTAMISVDFDDSISAGDVEHIVCTIEEEAHKHWPQVRRLYIRPRKGSLLGSKWESEPC
ncbi:cation diffusion facilitator family transporter [Sphingomonas sp. RG327]|jgi:cation diffusion facilitator family transporter|uniref:Cation diffusion facilitator family transporter n=1 Tax=Sphingomonas anseongensis TaxID=2908207 RepID=A0ABT0RF60_9SPHN|nr:cation diffusion facilitator family transporter [Sphingomonas anseongensis]MCL6678925.1 cation diffusion facilitator family transporter [Sphingomonas anseongensis]